MPTSLCANEWIDEINPERVRNVPNIVRKNVARIRQTFQTFSDPRRSWIMVECRNAVMVNHGMHAAFSTGSHAQKPPQPSSSYAHNIPSVLPIERNTHANSAQ